MSTARKAERDAHVTVGENGSRDDLADFIERTGFTEEYARFVFALERGDIPPTGDVIALDAEGRELYSVQFRRIDKP